jgi:hypothetical protein
MLRLSSAALLLALGASSLSDVPLNWKPTDETGELLGALSRDFRTKKVQVEPFTDARDDKKLIGRNTESSSQRVVTTRDDAGAWCATQLSALLRQAGVPVVTDHADLVVSGKVTRFMVEEKDTYQGTVALDLTVKNAKGKQLWSGLVTGEGKRWGRSYKEENYMEALSDSLVRALTAFATESKLQPALEK